MKPLDKLIRPNILKLKPYRCARNEFTGHAEVLLDANENPYNEPYNRYPDPLQRDLKKAVSAVKHVPEECIFLGNGSDEAIDLAFRIFCEPGKDNVVAIEPTYGMYQVSADINNVEYRPVELESDFSFKAEKLLNATDEKKGADVKIYGSSHDGNFLSWWLGKNYTSSPTVISASSGYGLLGYTIRFDILISLAVAIVLCYYGQYIWLIAPIVYMLVSLAKGFLAVRRSHITLKEDYMEISNGKFAEIYNYVKYDNIEVVRMVSTPFTPYYHRVKLVISTNGTSFAIRSLKEHEAKEIYELLLLNCHNN